MSRFACFTVLVAALLFAGFSAVAEDAASGVLTLHVAPAGNDAATGETVEASLATLAGARDRIRQLRSEGKITLPVEVVLHGGTYPVTEPVVFGPEDSGTAELPVTYRAVPGETPVIDGGRRITNWTVENGCWVADLPEVREGKLDFGALWVNGERRTPARTPNSAHPAGDYPEDDDFFYMDGAVMVDDGKGGQAKSAQVLKYREGDIHPWEGLGDAVFVVFHSWETSLHRVKQCDPANRTVEFTGAAPWAFSYWRPDQWYFIENLYEGLDQPGEWCLRRGEGKLYYLPMPGETLENSTAVIPVTRQFLVLAGRPEEEKFVDYLNFQGVRFEHSEHPIGPKGHADSQAESSVPGAVECTGARNCRFEDCFIGHAGTYGLWLKKGCRDNVVARCEITDLGAGGVRVGETGSPAAPALAVENNTLDNCFLHDGGRIFRGAVGVWLGRTSYNRVSHNEICDFRYTGVSVGWSWGYDASSANHNRIEFNHIHDVGKGQLSDMGGIYTLGISPGTVLANNYIHDIASNPKVSGGWGLYTDEGSTDILLTNNVVINTRTGGFHQHYGRDNRVVNNIFAFSHTDQIVRSREEEHLSFFFERNIVVYNNGRLLGSNWGNGRFVAERNVYWDTTGEAADFKGKTLEEWQAVGHDRLSVNADPLFEDLDNRDFRLKAGSPALALGFQPIDVSQAGLYGDPEWTAKAKQVQRPAAPMPEPPSPVRVSLNFEQAPPGTAPDGGQIIGEEGDALIRIAETGTPDGKQALRITDAAGLAKAFNPHWILFPGMRSGTASARFLVRLSEGAQFYHEWRDGHSPYRVGPHVYFQPGGKIVSAAREVGEWKPGEWMEVLLSCPLGRGAAGTYSLTLLRDGAPFVQETALPCNPDFRTLDWFGFVPDGNAPAEIWLDALELRREREQAP